MTDEAVRMNAKEVMTDSNDETLPIRVSVDDIQKEQTNPIDFDSIPSLNVEDDKRLTAHFSDLIKQEDKSEPLEGSQPADEEALTTEEARKMEESLLQTFRETAERTYPEGQNKKSDSDESDSSSESDSSDELDEERRYALDHAKELYRLVSGSQKTKKRVFSESDVAELSEYFLAIEQEYNHALHRQALEICSLRDIIARQNALISHMMEMFVSNGKE